MFIKKFTLLLPVILIFLSASAQKVSSHLKFKQGQTLQVSIQLKTVITQEAMGQAIDFKVDGSATHDYKVTNATEDNSTLHHEMKQIAFNFNGMGQNRTFDSNNDKDMKGQFGKPIAEMLDRKFDMILDPTGTVLMVKSDVKADPKTDERMAIIFNQLKDVLGSIQPPQKGEASFFKILPDRELTKGDSWADTVNTEAIKSITNFTLADITDSTLVISFTANSVTNSKGEMMGMETSTSSNNKTTGKIILNKQTGIIREKTFTTESNGTTQVMGGSLPVTSKSTTTILVK